MAVEKLSKVRFFVIAVGLFASPAWAAAPNQGCVAALSAAAQASDSTNNVVDLYENPPHDYYEFTKVDRPAGGTQGGEWFQDQRGDFYFGKNYGGDQERILSEHLTSEIYRDLGVRTPKNILRRINGKPYVLSHEVPDASYEGLLESDVRNDFIIDAWLANWDVIGEDYDNVLVAQSDGTFENLSTPTGTALRIDFGGGLLWRAMGGRKDPGFFGSRVDEIWTMRESYRSGEIFDQLSDIEVAGQIRRFMDRYDFARDRIFFRIKNSGLDSKVQSKIRTTLDRRALWLFDKALPILEGPLPGGEKRRLEFYTKELKATMTRGIWDSIVKDIRYSTRKSLHTRGLIILGEAVAISMYMGGDMEKMDRALWGKTDRFTWTSKPVRERLSLEVQRPLFELLISGLKKLPNFKGNVERVMDLMPSEVARYRVGSVVTEAGFTSTTVYDGASPYPGNVTFFIKSKTGKDLRFMSENEGEVLFLPATKFKVIKKMKVPKSTEQSGWEITLQEI